MATYEVTRRWIVEAKHINDAIDKSHNWDHYFVRATKIKKEKEVQDGTIKAV